MVYAGQAGTLWQVSSVSWARMEALLPPPCRADLWLHMSSDWQELLTAFQIHSTTSVKTAVWYQSLTVDMLSVLRVDAVETEISVFANPVFCDSFTPEFFSSNHTSEPYYKCECDFWDLKVKFVILLMLKYFSILKFRKNFSINFFGWFLWKV